MIGISMRMSSHESNDFLPPDLGYLMNSGICEDGGSYIAPYSKTKRPDTPEDIRNGHTDYIYLGRDMKFSSPNADKTIIMYTKPGAAGDFTSILFLDIHVNTIKTKDFKELININGWILPPEKKPWHLEPAVVRYKQLSAKRYTIDFSEAKEEIKDSDMQYLSLCKDVEVLNLRKCNITDKGLADLGSLQKLKELNLRDTKITNAGLKYVSEVKDLEDLEIWSAEISDEGISNISCLKYLKRLKIPFATLSDKGMMTIIKNFSSLESLNIGEGVTDESLINIDKLQRLKELFISGDLNITDKSFLSFSRIPALKTLGIAKCSITNDGIICLQKLKNLQYLGVHSDNIDINGIINISNIDSLTSLTINGANITRNDLKPLAKLKKLTIIWFDGKELKPENIK